MEKNSRENLVEGGSNRFESRNIKKNPKGGSKAPGRLLGDHVKVCYLRGKRQRIGRKIKM